MAQPKDYTDFNKAYLNADLTFDDNGIYWVYEGETLEGKTNQTFEVMMAWEQPIMDKMADLCVSEGDDVLEIGFGMGILSDAIQAKKPASHTIIECHKDIIPKLKTWADTPVDGFTKNVKIIEGSWVDVNSQFGKYDAILQDTYADLNKYAFKELIRVYGREGCKVTYWNSTEALHTTLDFDDDVEFHEVSVNPPSNQYFNKTIYKVPLMIKTTQTLLI